MVKSSKQGSKKKQVKKTKSKDTDEDFDIGKFKVNVEQFHILKFKQKTVTSLSQDEKTEK